MSNAVATAALITTHDEFVAYYVANVSAFATAEIGEETVAKAQAGNYYEADYVAGRNSTIARLEAMSDAELAAELGRIDGEYDRVTADEDQWELDVDDYESMLSARWLVLDLISHREVMARYTHPVALTHNPFAALAA